MPWKRQGSIELDGDHQAEPGQVSESSDSVDPIARYVSSGETQYYRGYVPQRYLRPVEPPARGNAGEQGDGTVPNNTDRGNYGHGVLVDSEVWAKDHSRRDVTDNVPQVMPEEEDQREYDPIKVTVVDLSPDEVIVSVIDSFVITPITNTAQGTQATQQAPVRILGKDPRRKRALIAITNMTGGSVPYLRPDNGYHGNGFPLAMATTIPLETFTTGELWVSGASSTDSFTVCVYVERAVNADPYRND